VALTLAPNALTTVLTVQGEVSNMAAAGSDVATRLINVASDAIERFCMRRFWYSATWAEIIRPYDDKRLMLEVTPVASIVSVVRDAGLSSQYTYDPSDFFLEDLDKGIIYRTAGWVPVDLQVDASCAMDTVPNTSRRLLTVTYAGGYTLPKDGASYTLPNELEYAAIAIVTSLFRRRGVDLATEIYDDEKQGRWRPEFGGIIPGPILTILKRYQRLV